MWEILMEFLVLGFVLIQPWMCQEFGKLSKMEDMSFCLCHFTLQIHSIGLSWLIPHLINAGITYEHQHMFLLLHSPSTSLPVAEESISR